MHVTLPWNPAGKPGLEPVHGGAAPAGNFTDYNPATRLLKPNQNKTIQTASADKLRVCLSST
jgi:hypothetical protein